VRVISTDWETELAKEQPSVYGAFFVTLRDATGTTTTHVFTGVGGEFPDNAGTYRLHARLMSVGRFKIGFDPLSSSLALSDTEVTLADPDNYCFQLFEAAPNLKAECRYSWVSPNVADDLPRYSGLVKSYDPGDGRLVVHLGPDDRMLETALPLVPILKPDFPDLSGKLVANYGAFPAIVLGSHQSGGLKGSGMVPLLAVAWASGSLGWYTPGAHAFKAINNVYNNGTLKTLTTHYTVELSTVGGKTWQLVKFTAGNIPAEGDVITADVQGADLYGDGTGPMVANPVSQIRKLLVDYVISRYVSGRVESASESPWLDEPKWDSCVAIANARKLEGAAHIGGKIEQTKAREIIESWCESWPTFRVWRNASNQIAISFLNLNHPGYRDETGGQVVRSACENQPPRASMDVSSAANRISVQHLYGSATSEYFGMMSVFDPSSTDDVTIPLSFPWSAARIQ
jgi:hypothetical protein